MKKQLIYILSLLTLFFFSSCQQKDPRKKELQSALEEIDRLKGNYNPNYMQDSTGYFVIKTTYKAGAYQYDSTLVTKRRGLFPYRNEKKAVLPFVVSYYDASDRLIGMYSLENPAISRTCEDGKEAIRFNEGISFELLLPSNPAIRRYRVTFEGKEIIAQPVPGRIVNEKTDNETVPKDTIRNN